MTNIRYKPTPYVTLHIVGGQLYDELTWSISGQAFKIIHFVLSVYQVYQDKHIVHSVNEVSEIRGTLQGLTIHQQWSACIFMFAFRRLSSHQDLCLRGNRKVLYREKVTPDNPAGMRVVKKVRKIIGLTAEYPAILKLHLWRGWVRGYAVESTTPPQVNF